jgi:hypothetical protein
VVSPVSRTRQNGLPGLAAPPAPVAFSGPLWAAVAPVVFWVMLGLAARWPSVTWWTYNAILPLPVKAIP